MRGTPCILLAACAALLLGACGEPAGEPPARKSARAPVAAPRVVLTHEDRERWAPRRSGRSRPTVIVYRGVRPEPFARHMVLLDHAGYETITLDELVRFVEGERIGLPSRPLLLTFDGAALETWTASDGILRELGMNAAMFIDVGRVDSEDPRHLTWDELDALQRSGRWNIQLRSGTGYEQIRYGPARSDVGPAYAYRGSDEVLGGWRERVFSDITYGERQLSFRLRSYRPLAFAPPYGNYGQAGTNDPRIPRELRARLLQSFRVIFTLGGGGVVTPGKRSPIGRVMISPDTTEAELRALLR